MQNINDCFKLDTKNKIFVSTGDIFIIAQTDAGRFKAISLFTADFNRVNEGCEAEEHAKLSQEEWLQVKPSYADFIEVYDLTNATDRAAVLEILAKRWQMKG